MAPKLGPGDWYERVREGQRFTQDICGGSSWQEYKSYYRGDFSDTDYFYNLFWIFIHTIRPSIYFQNPSLMVTPWKRFSPDPDPSRHIMARVIQGLDNLLIREMKIKELVRELVFDAFFFSRGVYKIGFSKEHITPIVGEEEKEEKQKTEHDVSIQNGMPWAKRISPDQFIVPFGTRRQLNMPWACHLVLRRTEDVQKSSGYKNVKNISGSHINLLSEKLAFLQGDRDADWTEIHEVHDWRKEEIMSYIPDYSEENGPWIFGPKKDVVAGVLGHLPFGSLCFSQDPDFYWGPSDAKQLEPQQLEINESRAQTVAHRRLAILKFLFTAGSFGDNDEELEKLLDGDIATAVRVTGTLDSVKELQPHIPPDLVAWTEQIRKDARELIGVSRQMAGSDVPGRRTAREVDMIQQGFDIRVGERRDSVADLIGQIMTDVNAVTRHYWSIEEVIPVLGDDAAIYWVRWKNSDVDEGRYEVKVDVESLSPQSTQKKRGEVAQLLAALSNQPGVDPSFLLQQLVGTYGWADLSSILPQGNQGEPIGFQEFQAGQRGMTEETRSQGQQAAARRLGANV